ncbi:MAG: hypothetical protein KIT34_11095 [Cyanobacteria bacterium TGS_CYA1]|nr:hypothetical protein [Cyanobacteria bacterium TGS_CYA1]
MTQEIPTTVSYEHLLTALKQKIAHGDISNDHNYTSKLILALLLRAKQAENAQPARQFGKTDIYTKKLPKQDQQQLDRN